MTIEQANAQLKSMSKRNTVVSSIKELATATSGGATLANRGNEKGS